MLGKNAKLFFLLSLGCLLVAIVLAFWGIPAIVKKQIQKNIQLKEGSMMFDRWVKMPVPLIFKVHVFNVTNAEEVNKGEKPELKELGPYVYKEYRERTILGYGDNDTVKYMLKKTFRFDQEASPGLSEDDELTVINLSYMAAILTVQDMMPGVAGMINGALEQFFPNLTDPFLRVKAKDLFFDGIFLDCSGKHSALGLICGKIRSEMPPNMRPAEDGRGFYFSMFSHLNISQSGPYEMVRGTEDMYELGHIVSYKNSTSAHQWGDEYCGQLNGTDSTIFPPIDESNIPMRLYTFEPDICRSLYVSYVDKRSVFNMTAYYYEISRSALASKSAEPDNKCFCRRDWSESHDGCLIMGILNLMPCQGAPVIASFPHFYLASEELLEFIGSGIKPEKEKHNTFVYLDPTTGVPMKGVKRLQFNIELRNIKQVPQLENVPTGLFPLLWVEEGAEIPESIQKELRDSHSLLSAVEAIRWILLVAAIAVAVASAVTVTRAGAVWPHSNSVSFALRSGHARSMQVNKGI